MVSECFVHLRRRLVMMTTGSKHRKDEVDQLLKKLGFCEAKLDCLSRGEEFKEEEFEAGLGQPTESARDSL